MPGVSACSVTVALTGELTLMFFSNGLIDVDSETKPQEVFNQHCPF